MKKLNKYVLYMVFTELRYKVNTYLWQKILFECKIFHKIEKYFIQITNQYEIKDFYFSI